MVLMKLIPLWALIRHTVKHQTVCVTPQNTYAHTTLQGERVREKGGQSEVMLMLMPSWSIQILLSHTCTQRGVSEMGKEGGEHWEWKLEVEREKGKKTRCKMEKKRQGYNWKEKNEERSWRRKGERKGEGKKERERERWVSSAKLNCWTPEVLIGE